jgi:hypothetical protein
MPNVNPRPKQLALLLILLSAACAPGCRWNEWFVRHTHEPPPIVFSALPTRDEAVAAINANSQRVQSLQSQGGTISVPGAPAISAEVALARPKNLRFRAGTNLLGPELDLGSNDEQFWFWAARAPGSSVYFARHDQFHTSQARQLLAVEPSWLIEALGVVSVDPARVTEGPLDAGNGRVQMRTSLPSSAAADYSRLIVFDAKHAHVLEQHLYDGRGELIATSRTSSHEHYPLDGVSLPRKIEVQIPTGGLRFQLDVTRWGINQAAPEGTQLYELPRAALSSYPFVDIADPSFVPPGAPPSVDPNGPRVSQQPADDYRSRIRGLTR